MVYFDSSLRNANRVMGCSASHYTKSAGHLFLSSSEKALFHPKDKRKFEKTSIRQDSFYGENPHHDSHHTFKYSSKTSIKPPKRFALMNFLEDIALKFLINRVLTQPKEESVTLKNNNSLEPASTLIPEGSTNKETKKFSDISTTEKVMTDHHFSPLKTVSRFASTSGGPPEKIAISRNISTCRLKKFTNISSTYEISSQILGTGISGVVRVARHIATKRQYAIKTLSWEGVNPKRTAMLHNEVSIYLKLDHPNIARLIEVYESERSIHLVMELCTGGELYDRLAAKKKYNESDAAKVSQQMLSAINYCHQHHICHRDLKLENWVYADNSANAPLKLIDFGFSRIFNPGVPMTAMHGTVYYVSPEVMDGCYKETCDIWSIGVIVYMLLSGSPPFNGAHDHEILIKIKRGFYSMSGPQWEGISEQAKCFIRFLLQKDPDKRPSAEEALKHPWLQQQDTVEHDIDLSVVKSMRDFALANILRRAALGVVALGMTSQEVADLELAFRKLDKNNKGTIQLQDLVKVLCEKLNVERSEAHYIFEKIDQTGKQEVHYTEFIAATLQAKFIKDDTLIREAFQRFDVEGKKRITLENLRSIIGDSFNGTKVEHILDLCDTNRDGCLDYNEFYKALTSNEAILSYSNMPPLTLENTVISDPFKKQQSSTQISTSIVLKDPMLLNSSSFMADPSTPSNDFFPNTQTPHQQETRQKQPEPLPHETAYTILQSVRKAVTSLPPVAL